MKNWRTILAIIVLIVSLVLLFDKLFTPQPIQILLPSGTEITTQNSESFTFAETLLLLVCSFLIGITSIYLFYTADKNKMDLPEPMKVSNEAKMGEKMDEIKNVGVEALPNDRFSIILPLLKDDEKIVFIALKDAGGEMHQNQLVLKLNLSKVKVTRLLYSMEQKNLIVKERNGLTNNIKMVR